MYQLRFEELKATSQNEGQLHSLQFSPKVPQDEAIQQEAKINISPDLEGDPVTKIDIESCDSAATLPFEGCEESDSETLRSGSGSPTYNVLDNLPEEFQTRPGLLFDIYPFSEPVSTPHLLQPQGHGISNG